MLQALKAAAQQQGSPFKDDYRDACLTSGAVGLWMLDETTGTTAVDQGSAGVDATYRGDMATSSARGVRSAFNIPLAGVAAADSGTSGNGFRGGVIEVPSSSAFVTEIGVVNGAMSYEWVSVKDYNAASYQYWFKHYASGFSPNIGPLAYIRESSDNATSQTQWQYQITSGGNYSIQGSSPTKQTPGVASHNVVTFDTGANYLRWYRNGVRIMNWYQATANKINGATAPIYIGNLSSNSSHWPSYGLQGAMGGVAVYDYALSQTNVTTHYNALLV
jgi:hypothetical protein